jgi:hypothetical protein
MQHSGLMDEIFGNTVMPSQILPASTVMALA